MPTLLRLTLIVHVQETLYHALFPDSLQRAPGARLGLKGAGSRVVLGRQQQALAHKHLKQLAVPHRARNSRALRRCAAPMKARIPSKRHPHALPHAQRHVRLQAFRTLKFSQF